MRLKNKLLALGCVALTSAALFSGVACNDHEIAPFTKSLSAGKNQNIGAGTARAVDILFVIDNSNSMVEEQQGLDKNFGVFLEKLNTANANFRLAAVSTSYTGSHMSFVTNALDEGASVLSSDSTINVEDIKAKCLEYFGEKGSKKTWVDYEDFKDKSAEERSKEVKDLFRCQAIMGVTGDGTEKGLASMKSALENKRDVSNINDVVKNFKRPGSILTIVFVTDENDCSTNASGISADACETRRNIEDSCIVARADRIVSDAGAGSNLQLSNGQTITYGDDIKTLRDWCVQGDDKARKALLSCLDDESCNARSDINCPADPSDPTKKKCLDALSPRRDFYDFIIDYVSTSNEAYYRSQNPDKFDKFANAKEHRDTLEELARGDVIVASIINRDQGVRYNQKLPENWCGVAGSQSYRYQLFAEMFKNDPIYAPICCKNERFVAFSGGQAEAVCDEDPRSNGKNGNFGPVLGVIGQRIGEAVNTLCADSAPVTCQPADCNVIGDDGNYTNEPRKDPSAACTCQFGCNTTKYLANSAYEYHLCNEFQFSVGTVDASGDMNTYTPYSENKDYMIDYESTYCQTRTGSPIQIRLIKSEIGRSVLFQYPKKVSGIY